MKRSQRWPNVMDGSQSEQILDALEHGRWMGSRDLHRRVFCVLHSRIAELRKRGYVIEHRGVGFGTEHHEYRLAGRPLEDDDNGRTGDVASSRPLGHSLATEAAPSSSSGCVSGVLPDNDRVDTNVQSPAPLDPSVLPDGQLTLRWAA